jgi:hypothetical protein
MKERQPTALILRFGDEEVGILAPLPASLTQNELLAALDDLSGGPSNVTEWLARRLFEVTGRRYEVDEDIRGWEKDGAHIVYVPVSIRHATD